MNLHDYSDILVSVSGGKDSQTILGVMMDAVKEQGYSGNVRAIHADTGAEWPQSLPHCEMLCKHYGVPLEVGIPYRALPAHIERRCAMMAVQKPRGKPGWPSSQQRYCTSDCKRAPIQKVTRRLCPGRGKIGWNVLTVTGERREESPGRAKLPMIEPDKDLTAGKRVVARYRPVLDYTLDQVWSHIARTGLPRHVAYDLGNERVSCAICVLAKDQDIRNGAKACPGLAAEYLRIEKEYGFTMKNGKSLAQILAEAKDHE